MLAFYSLLSCFILFSSTHIPLFYTSTQHYGTSFMYFVSFFYTAVFIFSPICGWRRISCYKKTKSLSGRISRVSYSLIHRGNLKAAAVRLFLADLCVLIRWVINLNPAVFQFSEIVLHWLIEVSRLANICCWSDTTLERIVVYALDLIWSLYVCWILLISHLTVVFGSIERFWYDVVSCSQVYRGLWCSVLVDTMILNWRRQFAYLIYWSIEGS